VAWPPPWALNPQSWAQGSQRSGPIRSLVSWPAGLQGGAGHGPPRSAFDRALGEPTHHNLLESDPPCRNESLTLTKCGHGPSWTTLVAGIREYEITC
jgi:hypothetical protein